MSSGRLPFVVLLCLLLIAARSLGLHVHHAPEFDHRGTDLATFVAHSHHSVHLQAVTDYADDHAAEHLAHGAVDAETPDKTFGKLPSLFFVALVAVLVALLPPPSPPQWLRPQRHAARRRWAHFKPHSHAPPNAG